MKIFGKYSTKALCFSLVLATAFMTGCGGSNNNNKRSSAGSSKMQSSVAVSSASSVANSIASSSALSSSAVVLTVVAAKSPSNVAVGIRVDRNISATFNAAMDDSTITTETFVVTGPNDTLVPGVVTYADMVATFNPDSDLQTNTSYTVTIKSIVKNLAVPATGLATDSVWTFTTAAELAQGPEPVNLGTAINYVILAKSAVSATVGTTVTGNIGLSPAAESFITGFSQTRDATNEFSIASMVTGNLYAANMAAPTPTIMTTAIGDMEIAYTDAAGRSLPDFTERGAGDISGMTLVPGLYKWGTGVSANTNVTLSGGANDVWIFQIANNLTVASGVIVTLDGGALAKNVFWQVAGKATLGTTADFKGIILSQTQVILETGAILNGRALAQTAITLDASAVTAPAL
ncbi:MAG: ice-binding family protein [Pseudomonadota bacterium]